MGLESGSRSSHRASCLWSSGPYHEAMRPLITETKKDQGAHAVSPQRKQNKTRESIRTDPKPLSTSMSLAMYFSTRSVSLPRRPTGKNPRAQFPKSLGKCSAKVLKFRAEAAEAAAGILAIPGSWLLVQRHHHRERT